MMNNYIWKYSSCSISDKYGKPLWEEYTLYKGDDKFYCGVIKNEGNHLRYLNYKYVIDIYLSPNFNWQGGENDLDVAKFKAIVKVEELYKQFKMEN